MMKKVKRKTTKFSIFLMVIVTFIFTIGNSMLKKAADNFSWDIFGSIFNIYLIGGLFLVLIGGILFIIALKYGELSVLYPIVSLSFVWVVLFSRFFLGEVLFIWQYIGILSIILGVSFLGVGSKCS